MIRLGLAVAAVVLLQVAPGSPYGPQASILCPIPSTLIPKGSTTTSRQAAIQTANAGTAFCLASGIHSADGSNVPKSGDSFTGQFGAIIDGTGWVTSDGTQAVFRAHNQDIDDITIKNLTLRNLPQEAVHAFKDFSDRWTFDHLEIAGCHTGIDLPNGALLQESVIHNCIGDPLAAAPADRGGAFAGYQPVNVTLLHNEFYGNGPEQKLLEGGGHKIQRNWFHNTYVGTWLDGDNSNILIEDNLYEDITWQAIFYEISQTGIIRRNTIRRAETAIFLSTSKTTDITGNILEDNWRGLHYYLNCSAIGQGTIGFDLTQNSMHDNSVRVGTRAGSYAALFSYEGTCPAATVAPYLSNAKSNLFVHNSYQLPAVGNSAWLWGGNNLTWAQWQTIPQDATGTMSIGTGVNSATGIRIVK